MKIVITIVVTAAVVGGGTYWYVNNKATADKTTLQSNIDSLNKKVADSGKPATTTTTDPDLTKWLTNYGFTDKSLANKVSFSYDNLFGFPTTKVSFTLPDGIGAEISQGSKQYPPQAGTVGINFVSYGQKSASSNLNIASLTGTITGNILLASSQNYFTILTKDKQTSIDYNSLSGWQKATKTIQRDQDMSDKNNWKTPTSIKIAGISASRYVGVTNGKIEIQFVKDGNYYEIGEPTGVNGGTADATKDDAITTSIIQTLTID